MLRELKKKISEKKARIGIVGVGYVGLSLAVGFAKKGFKVYGIDIDKARVAQLLKSQSFVLDIPDCDIAKIRKERKLVLTSDFKVLEELDAIFICVPTPLNKDKEPDISFIVSVGKAIARHLQRGQLIILQSTTYPGTTEEVLIPLFAAAGFKEGRDFFFAYSPERVDFGNKKYQLKNTPKIVGGMSAASTEAAVLLLKEIVDTVIPVSSCKVAEMAKLLENTFRLVNIGLINEIMLLCDKMGIDVWEVIEAAKSKPYGFMPFYPGPGIGGHCIPIDPVYLSWKARSYDFESRFIDPAYYLNRQMPEYVVRRIDQSLNDRGKPLKRASILIVGVTYKRDTADLRESPAFDIIEHLIKKGARVSYFDPYVPSLTVKRARIPRVRFEEKVFKHSDCVVIVADHSSLDRKFIARNSRLIVDTRNALKDIKQRSHIVKI